MEGNFQTILRPYKGVGIKQTNICSVEEIKKNTLKLFEQYYKKAMQKIVFFKVKCMFLVIDNSAKSMMSSADTCLTERTALACVYVCVRVS